MNRVFLHWGDDHVVHLQFPVRKSRYWWERGERVYEIQTYHSMPPVLSDLYGLEREWGFQLQQPDELAVFIQMKRRYFGKTPPLAVGGLFPAHTLPVPLEARGGMAIALIQLGETVDLARRDGDVTLFVEKVAYEAEPHPQDEALRKLQRGAIAAFLAGGASGAFLLRWLDAHHRR